MLYQSSRHCRHRANPMEWSTAISPRKPVPPARGCDCPATPPALIHKLLAKTAEERYQTQPLGATSSAALAHGRLSTGSTPSRCQQTAWTVC